jgi:hypothetical protein
MIRALATQSELAALKDALTLISENLNKHTNDSLSKAHGINIIDGPSNDGNGNDLSTYQDSHGDILGTHFVRFSINGVVYYAPAQNSTLAGNAGTGSLDTSDTTTEERATPGSTSLITDYATTEAQHAAIVEGLLLEHTLQTHQATHRNMSALAQSTFDTQGHTVGRYIVQMVVDTILYNIPCDTRLGGPPQPPRLTQFSPTSSRVDSPAGGGAYSAVTAFPVLPGGTKPFTYSYEYYKAGVWTAITPDTPTAAPFVNSAGSVSLSYSSTTGAITFTSGAPGGDAFDLVRVRLTVTGTGGAVSVDASGHDVIFEFQVQDHAPCCWFCTQANITSRLSPEEWSMIGRIEQHLFKRSRRMVAWYVKRGKLLVDKMVEKGVSQAWFEAFTRQSIELFRNGHLEQAAVLYRDVVAGCALHYWPEATSHRGLQAGLQDQKKP